MPPSKLTRARLLKFVRLIASNVAQREGVKLTQQAMKELLRPSAAYFARVGYHPFDADELRDVLSMVFRTARLPNNLPPGEFFADEQKRPSPPINADDVRAAMDRSTCHYAWFC